MSASQDIKFGKYRKISLCNSIKIWREGVGIHLPMMIYGKYCTHWNDFKEFQF